MIKSTHEYISEIKEKITRLGEENRINNGERNVNRRDSRIKRRRNESS